MRGDPMPRPLIVAHRMMGANGLEHARSSLVRLADAGADMAEIDIRLSLDRQPVVLHDATLGRTSRGRGWVRLWPSAVLGRLPLTNSSGERIPLLGSLLTDIPESLDFEIALHLKDRGALRPVLRTIDRLNLTTRVWLWLERAGDVQRARAVLPGIRCTLLRPGSWDEPLRSRYFADARDCGADGVSLQPGAIDANVIARATAHGLLVFTRIDDDDRVDHLIRNGVSGLITDDPARTRQTVDQVLSACAPGRTCQPCQGLTFSCRTATLFDRNVSCRPTSRTSRNTCRDRPFRRPAWPEKR